MKEPWERFNIHESSIYRDLKIGEVIHPEKINTSWIRKIEPGDCQPKEAIFVETPFDKLMQVGFWVDGDISPMLKDIEESVFREFT